MGRIQIPDYVIHDIGDIQTLSQEYSWGITDLQVPNTWKVTDGKGVTVAVLDTGCPLNHDDLQTSIDLNKAKSCISDEDIYDLAGHGCIRPFDKIYTSEWGLTTIEDFFEKVNGPTHLNDEGYIIKDITNLNIKTLSMNSFGDTEPKRVVAVHKLNYDGPIFKITTSDGEIGLTPWHPVFNLQLQRGNCKKIKKTRADKLKLSDRIMVSNISEDFNDYIHIQYNKTSVKLDEDVAYILGLIHSDGHICKDPTQYRVSFFNKNHAIGNEFKTILTSIFNINVKYRDSHKKSNVGEWYVDDKSFHDFLMDLGIPKGNKTIKIDVSNKITKSPHSVIFSYYAGIIDGDGSVSKHSGRIRIISSSKDFVNNTVLLFRTLGIRASKSDHSIKNDRGKFKKSINPCYCIRIASNKKLQSFLRHKISENYKNQRNRYSTKIVNIEQINYTGNLYDLTVEDNNNYVANGIIVSNTHVAGIIAARNNFYGTVGVAPEATIIPVKVLNKSGMSQRSSVEDGLDYCIAIKPDIINMSLGGSAPMPSIKYRIDKLIAMGIPIVCSAGNNGKNQVLYPANYDEVFAIGSYSPGMIRKRSSFSSFGDELDFSAPGQEILSTWLNNQYAVLSGTSMAAPFVAGVLALLLSKYKKDKKNLTVAEIKQLLISSCLEAGREGFDQEFGWGIIYPEKLVATSSNVPPKVKPPRKPSFFDRFKRMFNK